MEQEKEYYAFISYKREDEKWARWLQNKLEHYRFPTNLNARNDLPKYIRPVLRDETDLIPGPLSERITNGLNNSQWLIVICSPRSAKSQWVNKEAQTFIDQGRADYIIPFIIKGKPFTNDINTECFPEALLGLKKDKGGGADKEILAADIQNELGREGAVVKVVAQMFGLEFDTLWQRYKRYLRKRRIIWCAIAALFVFLISILSLSLVNNYDQKVAEYCKTGIKPDDGIFNTQKRLLKYQDKAWLLKEETRTLLKQTIYNVDYVYNLYQFPIIYSYKTDEYGINNQLRFCHDESQIVIAATHAGILDCKQNKFTPFESFALDVDCTHDGKVIACGKEISKYDHNAKLLAKYEIDGYGIVMSPQQNSFACKNKNSLTTYRMNDGSKESSKSFAKNIICYAYNKSGEYLAVATSDSLLSLMRAKTGEIVCQQKYDTPIIALTAAQDDKSFFAAFYGDSTKVAKVAVEASVKETILFNVPTHTSSLDNKNVLSYTSGDYLAYTNGRYFILYNVKTGGVSSMNVIKAFNAEMDALTMSPSGTKVCCAIKDKVYVMEIHDYPKLKRFPLQQYGFSNPIGATTAAICSDDTTIVMAVIKTKEQATVGMYNLYTGKAKYKTLETSTPVSKVLPLPRNNHAAVAFNDIDSWMIIDFDKGTPVKALAPDTLTCRSDLTVSANRKYLIGSCKGPFATNDYDSRGVWSATTYDRMDSVYFLSGPLQDGEHMYKNDAIYSYPEKKFLFRTDYLLDAYGSFDGSEMIFVEPRGLSVLNYDKKSIRSIDLSKDIQGRMDNYHLVGARNGFAILLNDQYLIIIDTQNGDVVLKLPTSSSREIIASATFFNHQSKVLITTNAALYIYDLLQYDQLIQVWHDRLRSF